MKRRSWTKEETILAINLYCKIPFGKTHHNNPDIIALATLIDRSPNSIALKLGNIACIDPNLPRKGLTNYTKMDQAVWSEFENNWEQLAFESEVLLAQYEKAPVEVVANIAITDLPKEGKERAQLVKTRVNQAFFRKAVLASYNNSCCITGIDIPKLLIASHIKPWSVDTGNRINPCNGLCLNNLHDKAFDSGLITIDTDMKIVISKEVKEHYKQNSVKTYFDSYDNKQIILPKRFLPDDQFLEFHRTNIFQG